MSDLSLTKFYAEFQPLRIDDLDPEVKEFIGIKTEWQRLRIIEDGQFGGQWACEPTIDSEYDYKFEWWVPECDLKPIEEKQ